MKKSIRNKSIVYFLSLVIFQIPIAICLAQEININSEFFDTAFLEGKEYLNLDPKQLEQLSDDQFLERIQYDYTKNCLLNKDSIAVVENRLYFYFLLIS